MCKTLNVHIQNKKSTPCRYDNHMDNHDLVELKNRVFCQATVNSRRRIRNSLSSLYLLLFDKHHSKYKSFNNCLKHVNTVWLPFYSVKVGVKNRKLHTVALLYQCIPFSINATYCQSELVSCFVHIGLNRKKCIHKSEHISQFFALNIRVGVISLWVSFISFIGHQAKTF